MMNSLSQMQVEYPHQVYRLIKQKNQLQNRIKTLQVEISQIESELPTLIENLSKFRTTKNDMEIQQEMNPNNRNSIEIRKQIESLKNSIKTGNEVIEHQKNVLILKKAAVKKAEIELQELNKQQITFKDISSDITDNRNKLNETISQLNGILYGLINKMCQASFIAEKRNYNDLTLEFNEMTKSFNQFVEKIDDNISYFGRQGIKPELPE